MTVEETKSPSLPSEDGYTFLAVVDMNGKKVLRELRQPALIAGITSIPPRERHFLEKYKAAGTAGTNTESPTKLSSKGSGNNGN